MENNVIALRFNAEISLISGGSVPPSILGTNTFTDLDGRPIWWTDCFGKKHVCEGIEVSDSDDIAVWTLCQRDIDASEVFEPAAADSLTCDGCIAVVRDRIFRQEFEVRDGHSLELPRPANDDG